MGLFNKIIDPGGFFTGEPDMAGALDPGGEIFGSDVRNVAELGGVIDLDSMDKDAANTGNITPGTAAQRYAQITREQWENYKKNGIPIENNLIKMIGDKQGLESDLASAQSLVQKVGDVSASETNRTLSQYGVTASPDQAKVNDRLNKLSTTASMGDVKNFVRQKHRDLDQIIVSGSPNMGLTPDKT